MLTQHIELLEDLRKWNRWEVCDRILGLYGKKSHDIPIVKRSIIRYALSCPAPKAKEFVELRRKADPETRWTVHSSCATAPIDW